MRNRNNGGATLTTNSTQMFKVAKMALLICGAYVTVMMDRNKAEQQRWRPVMDRFIKTAWYEKNRMKRIALKISTSPFRAAPSAQIRIIQKWRGDYASNIKSSEKCKGI